MDICVRVLSFISGAAIVCTTIAIFLWQYGARGLCVPAYAMVGACVAMLGAQHLCRRAMTGVASIVGGAIAGMVGATPFSQCVHSDSAPTPYVVLVGAVLGGAIWVVRLSIPVCNKEPLVRCPEQEPQGADNPRRRRSEYRLVSLASFVSGPTLGLLFCIIYHLSVGIDSLDQWYAFGYHARGAIGATLCHVSVGAVAGLLFAVPYLIAWLIERNSGARFGLGGPGRLGPANQLVSEIME